jgi:hypothetical protein
VCGPNALKSGVSNTVASMQKLVLEKKIECISLDGETFGKSLPSKPSCGTFANMDDRMVMQSLMSFSLSTAVIYPQDLLTNKLD